MIYVYVYIYIYNEIAQRCLRPGAGARMLGRLCWLGQARLAAQAASIGLFATFCSILPASSDKS